MSTPAPPRKRRWLRGVLSVLAGLLVAIIVLLLTHTLWLGPTISRIASRATGKNVEVRAVSLGRALEIAELVVSDPAAPEPPLAKLEGLSVAFALSGGYRLGIEEVTARRADIHWKEIETANNESPSIPVKSRSFFREGRRNKRDNERFLPYAIRVDELNIDAEAQGNKVQIGPINVTARARPLSSLAITVSGAPKVHAERAGFAQPIDSEGTVQIDAKRDGASVLATIAMALPGVSNVEGTFKVDRVDRGFEVLTTFAKGTLDGPLWPLLASNMAGTPVEFTHVEITPGATMKASFGESLPSVQIDNAALAISGLRVGTAEAPWIASDVNVAIQKEGDGIADTKLRVRAGKDLLLTAQIDALLPPSVLVTFDKLPVASLAKTAPALARVHDVLPALTDIFGSATLSKAFGSPAVACDLKLSGRLKDVEPPLALEAHYVPGAPSKISGAITLGEGTHAEVEPFALAVADPRMKYKLSADLAEAAPLLGLADWGGTIDATGELAVAAAGLPGRFEAKCLNLVSDHFRLPYDVPMNVSASHAMNAKVGGLEIKDLKASIGEDTTATIARLATVPKIAANDTTLNLATSFLAAQGFFDSGDGAFGFKTDSLTYADGAISTNGEFTADMNNMVLPAKLAAAVNLRGKGQLGWNGNLAIAGDLTADKILCAGAELENASGTLRADGPAIVIYDIKGTLFGGAAVGSLRIEPFAEGMPATLDARLEGADLAAFTTQVKPPSVNLTGNVSGNLLVGLRGDDFTALDIDLAAPAGITVNKALVQELLLSQQMSGITGSKMVGKVLEKIVGGDEQRPFDSAELTLGLGEGRITGVATIKSKALNLDVDIKADPGAVWEAIQSRGEIHFGDFSAR